MAGRRRFDETATLDAAMRAFWAHGYEGASIRMLEQATGLGRQSLYGAFGDKSALFEKALARYAETVTAPIAAALSGDDPGAAFDAIFAAQRDPAPDAPRGCLLALACAELGPRDDALGAAARAAQAEALGAAGSAFMRWRDAGRVSADLDPAEGAALLLALLRGVADLDRAAADPSEADAAARAAAAALRGWAISRG